MVHIKMLENMFFSHYTQCEAYKRPFMHLCNKLTIATIVSAELLVI